jgi:hypothetical protein
MNNAWDSWNEFHGSPLRRGRVVMRIRLAGQRHHGNPRELPAVNVAEALHIDSLIHFKDTELLADFED